MLSFAKERNRKIQEKEKEKNTHVVGLISSNLKNQVLSYFQSSATANSWRNNNHCSSSPINLEELRPAIGQKSTPKEPSNNSENVKELAILESIRRCALAMATLSLPHSLVSKQVMRDALTSIKISDIPFSRLNANAIKNEGKYCLDYKKRYA